MSRYINADAVENTLQQMETITAMSHIELGEDDDDIGEISIPIFTVRNIMNTAPSIDLVRCKDCKYRVKHHCNENYMLLCDDDDFCSMGERKENNV